MHIRRVRAIAFGGLREAELGLAPGLTVVAGPNESGKSTWHAAVYAALCGMRRARGGPQRADRDFADRHRPWGGDEWEVACEVVLADGRVVELRHDLAGRVDCRAVDLATGQDVSDAIVHDGAPDGARWLGLDRRAFAAVACVRQAEIMAVTGDVDALQQHLQRAAATAGTDETAAAALAALTEFRSKHVGSERASTRPLARARARARAAELAHAEAQRRHEAWLTAATGVACLETIAAEAHARLQVTEAAVARAELDRLETRVERVRVLAARHPVVPAADDDLDAVVQRAATAVRDWRQRPAPVTLEGDTADELAARLDALPAEPDGDTVPAPEVLAAARALDEAVRRAELHRESRPAGGVAAGVAGDLTEGELIDLARELEVVVPAVDGALRDELAAARTARDEVQAAVRRPLARRALVLGVTGLVAGAGVAVGGVVAGQPAVWGAGGAVALVVAVVALVLALRSTGPDPAESRRIESRLRDAETRLAVAEQAEATARLQRDAAAARATERGLPDEAAALRQLADELRRAEAAERERRAWQARHEELTGAVGAAAGSLAAALASRGVGVTGPHGGAAGPGPACAGPDASSARPEVAYAGPQATPGRTPATGGTAADPAALLAAVDAYTAACRERAATAAAAAQRPALAQALATRRQLEAEAEAADRRRAEAATALRSAAVTAGLSGVSDSAPANDADLDVVADRLEGWEQERRADRAAAVAARQEWAQLQALLDGATVDELEATLADRRARAAELTAVTAALDVEQALGAGSELAPEGEDPAVVLRRLRGEAAEAAQRAVAARAEHQRDGEQLPSVAVAEEELAAARAELARVEDLDRVLTCTTELLEAAQDRVHRDIAPVLARKVQDRLGRITGGRYTQVTVDPQDLAVRVRDPEGHWREAGRLSHGTAEQVYLLLRVAMAEILTGDGARCPLLLDDVTVQSDPERTTAVLDVLHDVSTEHQVVLFTQEDDVVRWADTHLGDRDALVRLGSSGSGRAATRFWGGRQPAA